MFDIVRRTAVPVSSIKIMLPEYYAKLLYEYVTRIEPFQANHHERLPNGIDGVKRCRLYGLEVTFNCPQDSCFVYVPEWRVPDWEDSPLRREDYVKEMWLNPIAYYSRSLMSMGEYEDHIASLPNDIFNLLADFQIPFR